MWWRALPVLSQTRPGKTSQVRQALLLSVFVDEKQFVGWLAARAKSDFAALEVRYQPVYRVLSLRTAASPQTPRKERREEEKGRKSGTTRQVQPIEAKGTRQDQAHMQGTEQRKKATCTKCQQVITRGSMIRGISG